MRVQHYAPPPRAATGVAAYAQRLQAAMSEAGAEFSAGDGLPLYHLGNNPWHADIYERSLREPGLVVLHDAVLHHFLLGRLSEEQYREEFIYNYGVWHSQTAEQLWTRRARAGADQRYFAWPMLKRAMKAARAVVVHNPMAEQIVRRHAPQVPLLRLPHLMAAMPEPSAVQRGRIAELRRDWVASGETCVFAVMGYLRSTRRLVSVLRAFHRLQSAGYPVRLLIAGAWVDGPEPELLQRTAGVARRPFFSDEEFPLALQAADVVVNLHWPSAGETSGILLHAMAAGRPCIVSDGEEVADLPEKVCVRCATGAAEEEMLGELMAWLVAHRVARQDIGEHARWRIQTQHQPVQVAQSLLAFAREVQ
jgi:glycosyltransferase involved in cell wall biosynthesis